MYKPFNTFSARAEILRGGGVYTTLEAYEAPEITCDTDSDLVLAVRGTFYMSEPLNFYTDRLRMAATLNGVDYPCGTFVITTAERSVHSGRPIAAIEGYSLLYLAQRKKLEERLTLAAGTNYIAACTNLLSLAGITDIEATPTDYTLSEARQDWEIGTSVLEVINTLLSEIAYDKAYVSLSGKVILKPYTPPTLAEVDHTYTDGEASVILPTYKITDDRWGKANVFRVWCDNADKEGILIATAENNSPSSPYSTVNAGRILYAEKMDNTPSMEALTARANMLRDQSMQTEEEIEFYTAPAPVHEPHDTVAISIGSVGGIYAETGWSLVLSASAEMKHTGRRIIT